MALFHVYDTISDKHSSFRANGKIKDIYPKYSGAVILDKGCRVDGEYEAKENDVIFIREYPKGTEALAVIAIVSAVVALGVGVGSAIYSKKKMKQIQEEYEKQQDAANIQILPFLRGAKNTSALGKTIPFMLGRNYFAPYTLNSGYYSIGGIDGKTQFWNAVLTCGYNNQRLESLSIGSAKLKTFDQSQSQDGEYYISSSVYGNIILEVKSNGEMTNAAFGQKAIGEVYGEEIRHEYGSDAVPIVKQLPENVQKVEVCLQFNGLRAFNDGNWENRSVKVVPYWSNNADAVSPTWHPFTFTGSDNNTISRNERETIRFVATHTFTAEESFGKNISIKIIRETEKTEDSSAAETAILQYINTFCYDAKKSSSESLAICKPIENPFRDQTLSLGLKIPATENSENILDEINIITCGMAKTFSGSTLSQNKTVTRNPISCIMELLTSEFHPISKYEYSELKTQSFLNAYNYCETNNFYCDYAIIEGQKKKDVIEKILSTIGASLIIGSDGLLEIAIDKAESTPVALLNAQNIKSMTFARSFDKQITGCKTTYKDGNSFAVSTEYFMKDGGSYDQTEDVLFELALDTVSTHEHAYKVAQRYMRQLALQPNTLKIEVGMEGELYPLYSTVMVQLEQLQRGIKSSTVHEVIRTNSVITGIKIGDEVEFVAQKRYGVVIQAQNNNGTERIIAEVQGTGKTNVLTFVQGQYPQITPEFGNIVSFGLLSDDGEFISVTQLMKIYDITPSDNHCWNLELKDYNPEMYETGTIPDYKPNLTYRPTTERRLPTATREDVALAGVETKAYTDQRAAELSTRIDNIVTTETVCQADLLNAVYEIGEDGVTTVSKETVINISLHQGEMLLPFTIGNLNLPSGFTYRIEGSKLILTCGEGVKIKAGSIAIPVEYRPIITAEDYVDENGEPYVDENGNVYQYMELATSGTTWTLYFTFVGSGFPVYLGPVSSLSNLPENPNIGDYIVWAGTNHTASQLEIDGEFLQGRAYKYIGENKAWKWESDISPGHAQIVLSDVLGIANADLEHNNSTVYEYLDHLTSNSIYTGFLVANQAFINNLASKLIEAELVTTDYLESNYTKTSELTASLIKVGTGTLDNTLNDIDNEFGSVDTALAGKASNTALNNIISGTTAVDIKNAKVNGNTLIQGGYIKTEFIDVDTILGNNAVFRGTIQVGDYSATTSKGAKLYTANGDGYLDVTNLRANSIANRVEDINGVKFFSIYTERLFFNGIFAHDTIKTWNWKNSQAIDSAYITLKAICNTAGEGNYIQPLSCSFNYSYQGNSVHVTGKIIRFTRMQMLTAQWDKIIASLFSETGSYVDSYAIDMNSHIICRADLDGNLITTSPVTSFSTVIV